MKCLHHSLRCHFSKCADRFIPVIALLLLGLGGIVYADETGVGPNLIEGDFESGNETYNPWAGVDDSGNLHVWEGAQLAVDDNGAVNVQSFSPSVAVGDLNGDGLPDLVVADARGYFWFYPNSGKPGAPVFTHAEIIPLWLGDNSFDGDVVPRIQLIDYDGDGKLDIVAGNYKGQLYFLRNGGSATEPGFSMPSDFTQVQVPTRKEGQLWCNYLAPFLFDWSHSKRLDLTMGDGSYSANSIYLLANQGDLSHPVFNAEHTSKLIPGMGREDLTPQVVDWDNDGKPDIITGERSGYIDLYLNKAVRNDDPPLFDKDHPQHVVFGSSDQVGAFTTVCAAHLFNTKLFDLIVGSADGTIACSRNIGTLGNPKFGPLIPLKGINPYPKIILPNTWSIVRAEPYGIAYQLLECTNAQVEPGFTPPPGFSGKGALKFSVLDPHNRYFKDPYVPQHTDAAFDDTKHNIVVQHVGIQTDTRYIVSFWVRSSGDISNLTYRAEAWQEVPTGSGSFTEVTQTGEPYPVSSTWTRVSADLEIDSKTEKKNIPQDILNFKINWDGDGVIYFDDISIKRAN